MDFGCCDLEFVHPSLDGRLVPVRVAYGQLECDVASLSPDSSRDGSGDLKALDEYPSVVVDNFLGVVSALRNVDVLHLASSGTAEGEPNYHEGECHV